MKKSLSLIIILTMLSSLFISYSVFAYDENYIDQIEYEIINDEYIKITAIRGSDGAIPEVIDDLPVRYIAAPETTTNYRNNNYGNIRSLTIPKSITIIEAGTFRSCTNLEEVIIFADLETIESNTFARCTNLSRIAIPKTVTTINSGAFSGCNAIETVEYEGTQQEWVRVNINNNTVLRNNNILTFNSQLFNECGENLKWYLDEQGVLTISGTGDMTDYENADSVPWALHRENITSVVFDGEITKIGSYTFCGFNALTVIEIPGCVAIIGENAFENCTGLTEISISSDIKEIKSNAFANCPELKIVTELTEDEWNRILIEDGNDDFKNCIDIYNGEKGKCGDELTFFVDDNGVLTIEGHGRMYDYDGAESTPWYNQKDDIVSVSLPDLDRIGDYAFASLGSITDVDINCDEIGSYAFSGCTELKRIVMRDRVRIVETGAFKDCTKLSEVSFDQYVLECSFGNSVFENCASLTAVTIPNETRYISDNMFKNCESLSGMSLPEKITSIGKNAFYGCKNLDQINIPNSVESIYDGAFYGCKSLTVIDIPYGVTKICNDVFNDCTKLTRIDIPDTVNQIGDSAFGGCRSLVNITIPSSVITISDGAFSYCDMLSKIVLPEKLTHISERLFLGCGNLTEVNIPNVASIGERAFADCHLLAKIDIPKSVTQIGIDAFDAKGLTEINVDNDNEHYSSVDGNLFNKNKTILIKYASGKKATAYVIPETVTHIEEKAFSGCETIETVNIPENVVSIGQRAFENCILLNSVVINDNVTEIGECLFGGCETLQSVEIGNGITCINPFTFTHCRNLKNVVLGNNITKICERAFENCENIESIILPDSLLTIGECAFENCDSLITITIPDNVTYIGEHAFSSCDGLISVTIGDGVTELRNGVFMECVNLTSVTFPRNLRRIEHSAFAICDNIKVIYYNGIYSDWRKVEGYNFYPTQYFKPFVWVTFVDNEGNVLYKAKNGLGHPIYAYIIPYQNDLHVPLYNDINVTDRFDESTLLNENITLYVNKINGTKTLVSDKEEVIDDKMVFTIKGIHIKNGKHIILALYDDDKFIGFQSAKYHKGDIIFKSDVRFTDAKVMVWDDMGMLRPASESEDVKFSQK